MSETGEEIAKLKHRMSLLEDRVSKSNLSGGLARLVRLKPQTSDIEHGPEPSIRELIFNYYSDHGIENPEQHVQYYLSELERMAG